MERGQAGAAAQRRIKRFSKDFDETQTGSRRKGNDIEKLVRVCERQIDNTCCEGIVKQSLNIEREVSCFGNFGRKKRI